MTGVIYARYSSENQREESIEGQLRECTAFAQRNDITIIEHYIYRAYSAKTDNRPEFQRMIRESARKAYDVVYGNLTDFQETVLTPQNTKLL